MNFKAIFQGGLSDFETVLFAVIAALAVAIVILVVYILVSGKKRGRRAAAKAEPENPKAIPDVGAAGGVSADAAAESVYAPASEKEALEDGGEYDEIPTVFGEIAAASIAGQPSVPPVAPPVSGLPAEFESEQNAMRYNRSFRARLIQSDDEIKEWYGTLKNEILSYERVTDRISWKYESFFYRRNAVAKFFIKGKTLCLYLALDAKDYEGSKFSLEDQSEFSQFKDTPALYRIKSEKRVRYAAELIADICARLETKKTDREPVDYYEPYNGTLALIKKGLVKRVIEDAETSFTGAKSFSAAQDEITCESDE